MKKDTTVAIIPARYASSRLPGKPLADIGGLPMIVHVCRRASAIPGMDMTVVATDSKRICTTVEQAGFKAVLTSGSHVSGTDRVAEAADRLGLDENDIVVNIQGDQPLLESKPVTAIIDLLKKRHGFVMTTAACPMDKDDLHKPDRVKVVTGNNGQALYFSRSPIPFDRDGILLSGSGQPEGFPGYLRHLGLYAFRFHFLKTFVSLQPGILERIEMLEQLRAIENGFEIGVTVVDSAPIEVDTREDLERAREIYSLHDGSS